MYYDNFKQILNKATNLYDKAQVVYAETDDSKEYEDLDVQLDYCEEAIIRTFICEFSEFLQESRIDIEDLDGDEEYIELLQEDPGRHMLEKRPGPKASILNFCSKNSTKLREH